MGRLLFFIVGLSLLVAVLAPTGIGSLPKAASAETATIPVPAASPPVPTTTPTELSLKRSPSGHFETNASVNGQPLPFVVDTGADIVALTIEDARKAGLFIDPTSFTVIAQGASGPVRGVEITLDRLEVNGQTIANVRAAVLEGLGRNLLGQSALAQLGAVEMKGDRMVLR